MTLHRRSLHLFVLFFLFTFFLAVFSAGAVVISEKAEFHHTKGTVELQQGNYEKAISSFQEAIKADPTKAEAYYLLGVTYSRIDELEKALPQFDKALSLDPELTAVHFDYGSALYKLAKYREALNQFKLSAQFSPERAVVHQFLGLTQYKLGQYDPALYSFNKAVQLDPKLALIANYYTGVIYYRKGNYSEARVAFDGAIKLGPDTAVAQSSKRFIREMDRFEKIKRWSVYAQLGFLYDSNVSLRSDDVPDAALPAFISDDEDGAFLFYGVGDYKILRNPVWDFGVSFTLYNTTHFDNDAFDLVGNTPSLYANYKISKDFRFRFQYDFSYYALDFDSFSLSNTFSPKLTWVQCSRASLVIDPSYSFNEFFALPTLQGIDRRTNTLRDSENIKIGFKQYLFYTFMRRQGYFRLSYNWEFNDTEGRIIDDNGDGVADVVGNGTDFEYQAHRVGFLVSIPLPLRFTVKPGFTFYRKDYRYIHSNLLSRTGGPIRRSDSNYMGKIEIIKGLFHFLDASLKYVYTKNDSNVYDGFVREVLDYDRHIITLSAIFKF